MCLHLQPLPAPSAHPVQALRIFGEDIHKLIDVSKAQIIRHGKKVRITIDMTEALVSEIDEIRQKTGVDRGALIKVWLHERVKQEKTATGGTREYRNLTIPYVFDSILTKRR